MSQGHLGPGGTYSHGQDGRATHGRDVHATLCIYNATGSDAPRWLGRGQPSLGRRIIAALSRDCRARLQDESAPDRPQPADRPLCWIILQGRHGSLIVWLDEGGLGVGPGDQRFANPTLASILGRLVEAEGLDAGSDGARWKAAVQAAAGQ